MRLAPRGLAAAAVALVVLGQITSFVHKARVQHAWCAEHGEAIHINGSPDPGASGPAERTLSRAPGEADEAHDHCDVACTVRAEAPDAPPSLSRWQPPRTAPAAPVAAATPNAPVYRLAPKTSPPA